MKDHSIRRGIDPYLLKLQHFNCHAQGETKASHEKFVTVNGPATEPGGYLLWQSNFEVPMLPPSEVPGCSIISIEYFVEVRDACRYLACNE